MERSRGLFLSTMLQRKGAEDFFFYLTVFAAVSTVASGAGKGEGLIRSCTTCIRSRFSVEG